MSMIEWVADALYRLDFGEGMKGRPEHEKIVYREYARAAIEAMREPTTPMGVAGSRWSHFPYEGWQAMIDAALAP